MQIYLFHCPMREVDLVTDNILTVDAIWNIIVVIRRSTMYSPCNEASTSLFHVKSGGLGEGYSCLAVTSLLHVVHVICINVLFGGHTITHVVHVICLL